MREKLPSSRITTHLQYLIPVNLLFLVLGSLFIYHDASIPFWDLKSHIWKTFDFFDGIRRFDFKYAMSLMSSDRAPGTAILLSPFFMILQNKLAYLQLLTLLVYGNLFIIGNVLLSQEIAESHKRFWYVAVPLLSPILWSLTLNPYFDLGPLVLTPWLIYFALKCQHFQEKKYSLLLGISMGLEVLFRSYGLYLLFAFAFAYLLFFAEGVVQRIRDRSFNLSFIVNTITGIIISIATAVAVSYVTLQGLYKFIIKDVGSTAYLWHLGDPLFYLKALSGSSLGGAIVALSVAGIALGCRRAQGRLLLYFCVASYVTFQFVVKNNDWRYSGAFAAGLAFFAAYFMSCVTSSNSFKRNRKVAVSVSLVVLSVLGLQLVNHLYFFSAKTLGDGKIRSMLFFPKNTMYQYQGNQAGIMRGIYNYSGKHDVKSCSVYIGKDKPEFNYAYYQGIQLLHNRKKDYLVYFSDQPRYHGIPANYFDIDMIVLGESQSAFNNLLFAKSDVLLRNYQKMPSMTLETLGGFSEPLHLWKRIRPLTVQEQIDCQNMIIALDRDNLHNIDQLLWIYKVKAANLHEAGGKELHEIAELIPRAFTLSSLPFDKIRNFSDIGEYLEGVGHPELDRFFESRGFRGETANASFELTPKEFDDRYNFRWSFMVADGGTWTPLVHNDARSFFKSDNNKWNTLVGRSHIDGNGYMKVVDKPLGVFWVSPKNLGRCRVSVASKSEESAPSPFEVTINGRKHQFEGGRSYDDNVEVKKGDIIGIAFNTTGSYRPTVSIKKLL